MVTCLSYFSLPQSGLETVPGQVGFMVVGSDGSVVTVSVFLLSAVCRGSQLVCSLSARLG